MNSHLKVIVQKFNAGPLLKDKDEPIDRRYFSTFRTILRTRVASDNVESQTYVTGIRKMPKFRTGDLEDNDEDKYVRPKFTKREEEIEINHDGNSNGLQQDKNANYKNNNTVEEPKALVIRRKPQLLGGPLEDDENAITEIKPIMNNAKNKEIKKSSSKGKKPNLSESEILRPESENLKGQGIRKKPKYLGGPLEDDVDVATKAEIEQIAIRNQKMMRRKPQYLGGPLVDDDFVEPSLNNELAETPSRFNSSNKKPEYGEGALEEDQGSENEIQHSTEEIGKQKQADIQHKKEEEEKARIEKDMAKSNDMDEIDQKDKQNKAQSEGPGSDKSSIEQATIIQGKISTDEADEEEQEELQEEKKEDENSSGKNTPKKITFKTAPEEGSVFNHEKTLRRRFRKKKLTNVPEAQEEDEERNKSGSRDPSLRKEINRSNSRELQTGLTASPGRKLRPVDSKNEVNPEQINKPYPFDMKNVKPRYMSSKGKDKEELENEEDSPSRNLKRLQTKSKTILNDAEDKNEDPERAASLEKSDEQEGNTAPNIKKEKEKEEKDKNKSYIAKRNPKKPVAKEQEVEQVEEPEVPYSTTVKTYSFLKAKSKNNESEVVNKLLDKQDSKDNEESAEPEAPYSTTIKTHKFLKAGSRKHAEVTKKEETIPKEIPQAKPELENLPKVKRIPLKNRFGQYRIGNFEEIDQVQEKVESNEDDTPKSLTLKKYQSSSSTDDNKTFKLHSIRPKGHISGDDSEDNTVKNRKLELGKLINQKLTSKDFMTPREKSFKTSDDEFRVESMKYSNSETERSLVKSTIFKLKKTKTQTSLADIDSPSRAKDTNEIKSGGKEFKISLPKFKSEKEIGTIELPPISAKGSGSKTQGFSSSRSVYSFQLPIESPEKNQQVESKTPGKHNILIEKRKQSTGTQEILDKLFSVVNGNEKEKNSGTSLSSLEGGNSKQLGLRRNQSMGMALKMDIPTQPDLASPDSERVYPATARNRVIIKRELNKNPVSKEADDVLVKQDKPQQDEYDFNNGVRKSFKIRTTSKDQIILKQEMSLGDKTAQNTTRIAQ